MIFFSILSMHLASSLMVRKIESKNGVWVALETSNIHQLLVYYNRLDDRLILFSFRGVSYQGSASF